MTESGALRTDEAIELAHGLIARIGEVNGVRLLFLKGPTAVRLGVRPPRPSSDVDVLCEPGAAEVIGRDLEQAGWRERPSVVGGTAFEHAEGYLLPHSWHYIHDDWPCDLDLHYSFPGFLAPAPQVFEALWARRVDVVVAHRPVPTCDVVAHAAVVGLHALRSPQAVSSRADLAHLVLRLPETLGASGLAQLAEVAAETGARETLQPLLEQLGVSPSGPPGSPQGLREWTAHTLGGAYSVGWLMELRQLAWLRRPAFLWRSVMPSTQELLAQSLGTPPSRMNVTRLRVRYWMRGARAIPRAARAITLTRRLQDAPSVKSEAQGTRR